MFEDLRKKFDKLFDEKAKKWLEAGAEKGAVRLGREQSWGWLIGFAKKFHPDDVEEQRKFIEKNLRRAVEDVGRRYVEGLHKFLTGGFIFLPDPPQDDWIKIEIPASSIKLKFEEVI